jgi:hypothetical protein
MQLAEREILHAAGTCFNAESRMSSSSDSALGAVGVDAGTDGQVGLLSNALFYSSIK